MLNCLERNKRGDLAYHLILSMHTNGIIGESITYNMVLSALSQSHNPNVLQVCRLPLLSLSLSLSHASLRYDQERFGRRDQMTGK